ncbi:Hypothetical predicted protein [Lecanosticta acicola]|uniref:Uncharacterized protein n=1 Tax=Lecanosticta acicola TaxID=111012 RepID=A0AAI9E853_9PEZI|nr:Hypothetical predicted protein [Lecanosticta acicola]
MDPHEWRESVLSTRSLSYISQAGSMHHPPLAQTGPSSRQHSITNLRTPTRRSTLNSTSEYSEDDDLEMVDVHRGKEKEKERAAALNDIPELPESVAGSLLFELPREIRDRIYAFCVTSRDGLPVEWPRPRDAPARYGIQAQLLRTCRIVHDEAASLLYTLNNLTFHHPSDANMFVHAFASSPLYGRQVTNLSLHIKAQDTRMWMPYLTSTDQVRSLRADYPNLKELGVRFRSNKWQHQNPPEANLKQWSEDSRLEEVMSGLRHAFLPSDPQERTPINEREFQEYIARNAAAFRDAAENTQLRKRLMELHKARAKYTAPRQDSPAIRLCCACRVHPTHFNALTVSPPTTRLPPASVADLGPPHLTPPTPVKEGEPFRGFNAIDFQNGVKRLHDPDLGSAQVARTPYANKKGILLALEVHCLDPKKDAAERAA